jgi:hypothetical protein
MHITALILGAGIIPFFLSYFSLKNIKQNRKIYLFAILSIITCTAYILVLSNNALGQPDKSLPEVFKYFTGRPILRYLDILTPLILILGFYGLTNYNSEDKKVLKKLVFISMPFFIISSQLVLSPLLPINNLSLTNIGAIKAVVNYFITKNFAFNTEFNLIVFLIMLIIFIALPFSALLINKISFKKTIYLVLSIFILTNILNFSIAYYKGQQYFNNDHMQLGLWFNEYDGHKISNVLFDYLDEGDPLAANSTYPFKIIKEDQYPPQYVSLIGFWMNDNLYFNDQDLKNMDYIVTKQDKGFFFILDVKGIKVYKLKV